MTAVVCMHTRTPLSFANTTLPPECKLPHQEVFAPNGHRPKDLAVSLAVHILRLLLICISWKYRASPLISGYSYFMIFRSLCRVTLFSATSFRQHSSDEESVRAGLAKPLPLSLPCWRLWSPREEMPIRTWLPRN
jgi:hypothetical protein